MEVNLTDWLGDNSWAIWLSLAFLLGIAEIMSLDLVLIMLAVGALAGAAVAVIAPTLWWLQILVASGISVMMLLLLQADPARQGAQHARLSILNSEDGRQQWRGHLPDRQVRRRDQSRRPELDSTSLLLRRGDRTRHRDRGIRDRRSHCCRLPEARATALMREGRSWISRR